MSKPKLWLQPRHKSSLDKHIDALYDALDPEDHFIISELMSNMDYRYSGYRKNSKLFPYDAGLFALLSEATLLTLDPKLISTLGRALVTDPDPEEYEAYLEDMKKHTDKIRTIDGYIVTDDDIFKAFKNDPSVAPGRHETALWAVSLKDGSKTLLAKSLSRSPVESLQHLKYAARVPSFRSKLAEMIREYGHEAFSKPVLLEIVKKSDQHKRFRAWKRAKHRFNELQCVYAATRKRSDDEEKRRDDQATNCTDE